MKAFLMAVAFMVLVSLVFAIWMRGGEEEALDYTSMAYVPGLVDLEQNGFTYLREFAKTHEAEFPDEYGYDMDYMRRANWDEALFTSILDQNREFISGVERAFDRPVFVYDLELTPETLFLEVGLLRSYVILRIMESPGQSLLKYLLCISACTLSKWLSNCSLWIILTRQAPRKLI